MWNSDDTDKEMKEISESITGCYTNIQRMCSHDGPGLRSTIFLKGCPLHCTWCHNPETISSNYEIAWNKTKCIGCHECVKTCAAGAIQLLPNRIHIELNRCSFCHNCIEECPTKALTWYGKRITPEKAFKELLKDRSYYNESNGGITISGGEPLLQPKFTKKLLQLAKDADIQTAVDTTCFASWKTIQELLPNIDIVLIDIKLWNPIRHQQATGVDNAVILSNIRKIADYSRENKKPKIFIRTQLIPGVTAGEENIREISLFIKENLNGVLEQWELLLFHNMCAGKYQSLERIWKHAKTPMITKNQVTQLNKIIEECGINKDKFRIQGLAVDD